MAEHIDVVVAEVSHPTPACPHPALWSCYDSEATELEVLDFLQTLVRMLKPEVVIETGCYRGHGTEKLAVGLSMNGFGHLWTTDIGIDKVEETKSRLKAHRLWPMDHVVTVRHGTGVQLIAQMSRQIDMAFLDSGPDEVRVEELKVLLPKLNKSGVVIIHDTGLQHGLRSYFLEAVASMPGLQVFMFDTPRGLSLVRKTWIP